MWDDNFFLTNLILGLQSKTQMTVCYQRKNAQNAQSFVFKNKTGVDTAYKKVSSVH